MGSENKKGHFTFRITAVLFVLSAVFEFFGITSAAPLFGEIRSGIGAGIYHVIYIVLFLGLGFGLWKGSQWGYKLVFITTGFFTLDKLQFLLGQQLIETLAREQIAGYEAELQAQGIDVNMIVQAIVLMSLVVVLCWWGFALYTYWRRDYFKSSGT